MPEDILASDNIDKLSSRLNDIRNEIENKSRVLANIADDKSVNDSTIEAVRTILKKEENIVNREAEEIGIVKIKLNKVRDIWSKDLDAKTITFNVELNFGMCVDALDKCLILHHEYERTRFHEVGKRKNLRSEVSSTLRKVDSLVEEQEERMNNRFNNLRTNREKLERLKKESADLEKKIESYKGAIRKLGTEKDSIEKKIATLRAEEESKKRKEMEATVSKSALEPYSDWELTEDKEGPFQLVVMGDFFYDWTIRLIYDHLKDVGSPTLVEVYCDDRSVPSIEAAFESKSPGTLREYRSEPFPIPMSSEMRIQGIEKLGTIDRRIPMILVSADDIRRYSRMIDGLIQCNNEFIISTDNHGLEFLRRHCKQDIDALRRWSHDEGSLNRPRLEPLPICFPATSDLPTHRRSAACKPGKEIDTLILCDISNSLVRNPEIKRSMKSILGKITTDPERTMILTFRTRDVSSREPELNLFGFTEFIDLFGKRKIEIGGNSPLCEALSSMEHILDLTKGDIRTTILITSNLGMGGSDFKSSMLTAYHRSRKFRKTRRVLEYIGDNKQTEGILSFFSM